MKVQPRYQGTDLGIDSQLLILNSQQCSYNSSTTHTETGVP